MALCIDGFLNSTVFCWEDTVYALGRESETGPLKLCSLRPDVRHVAVIPQPPAANLEDPRYLGVFNNQLAFLCADGMEYYTKRGQHRIYQIVLYIDPSTWQAAGCWRLDGDYAGAAEKNWIPLGDMEGDVSVVLYSHMSGRQLALDHRRRTVEERAPARRADSERALAGVRGGTPLLRQKDGTWRGFGHRVGEIRNPSGYMKWYNKDFRINQYLGTVHHYSADLRTVLSERDLPIWRGAVIHYPCGLADLGGGEILASIGIDDCSTIFVHLSSLDSDTILPSTLECRYSYLSDHIPRPPARGQRSAGATPTICLNMIVKNEEKIIERLLHTVTPLVDSYCICDTGSTDRTAAIIKSMTPGERAEPTIINGSRRARIAKGSGVDVSAVKSLVERFFEARKMMSRMAQGGGMPGMPGMPGSGGGPGRQKKKQKQAKGKRKSGNPMKRKAEEEAAAARREQGAQEGSPFGLPGGQPGKDFELPDEFKKFMG